MAQVIANHGHEDMIHDAVLDYYGRRLATCSSDRTIRIFDIDGETHNLASTLKGHDAAVWAVAWAHPKYGNILASCAYDGKVIIWREQGAAAWVRIIDFALHSASVNAIAWAPHELGAHLACAGSDGAISVLSFNDASSSSAPSQPQGQNASAWETTVFAAHDTGANAVSWSPSLLPGAVERASTPANPPQQAPVRRFASGGSDCLVKIWAQDGAPGAAWSLLATLRGHNDWVRDVAWSPSLLGKTYVASCGQDKTVRIWTLRVGDDASDEASWRCSKLDFECVVWRVSWSLSGNVLAVSGGDNKVTLWKERVRDGGWECVKTLDE